MAIFDDGARRTLAQQWPVSALTCVRDHQPFTRMLAR